MPSANSTETHSRLHKYNVLCCLHKIRQPHIRTYLGIMTYILLIGIFSIDEVLNTEMGIRVCVRMHEYIQGY